MLPMSESYLPRYITDVMEIEILQNKKEGFTPIIGEMTIDLLSRLKAKVDSEGIDVLQKETIDILSKCTNPNKRESQSITNLVVGYVQSGKTMSFTTLSALAHDNGYRIIIYFAGTNTISCLRILQKMPRTVFEMLFP